MHLGGWRAFRFLWFQPGSFFVSGAWASFVSLRQPTKKSAALSTSKPSNPCRKDTCYLISALPDEGTKKEE